jgi:hypothetical protein
MKKTIYVCDRCGQNRFAILEVDLAVEQDGKDELTTTAKIDVCAPCMARAFKLMLPYVPMNVRKKWYDEFREVADSHE